MFGKPEWFRTATNDRHLVPARWEGWAYTAAWTGAMALPFCALVIQGLVPEALFWLLVAGGCLVWDVRRVRKALTGGQASRDVDFLDESRHGKSTLYTRDFHMRLRR
jgi:hypothetical protein